ncbi:flagellar biosynthesis anti-sigma factor FlgM [Vagococcus penaei]|uniref:Negative regulator of flagellin synthesis n=1 Tax=Vagococcus penaei TaxID=633807 RepID=A0A1Q2D869_9ENTE|nr:flagellar biosynthesis anti-sigma factor FlgM [Vagococcus penaei]AQP54589.1 flagellar biosynthesis anti-sigma factor FlgM [Vagococcus penaei]
MKITNQNQSYIDTKKHLDQYKKVQHQVSQSAKEHSVTVDISSTSKKIRQIETNDAFSKAERIAQIKSAIKSGTYSVSPDKIAHSIVESMKEQR